MSHLHWHRGGSIPLSKHTDRVEDAEFSLDGKWIATASGDGTVKIRHIEPNETEVFVLDFSSEGAQRVSFSPDSQRLLALGGSLLKVWEVATLDAGPIFESAPDDNIGMATFVGNSNILAMASYDGKLHLVELKGDHPEITQRHTLEGTPEILATAPSGKTVAIGTRQGQVLRLVTQVENAKLEPVYDMGLGTFTALEISENDRWLIMGNLDGRAAIADCNTVPPKVTVLSVRPEDIEGFQRPPGTDPFGDVNASVDKVAFGPNGRYVAAGIRDGTVRLWNLFDLAAAPLEIRAHSDTILQVAFHPNSEWLLTSGRDGYTRIFSIPEGRQLLNEPHRHEAPVDVVELNQARTRLLTADRSGSVRLWWLEPGGQEPKEFPGVMGLPIPTSVAFDTRRERVAWSTFEPYTLVLTRLLNGDDPTLLAKFERNVTVAVSKDGRFLAASGVDPRIYLWDLTQTDPKPVLLSGHSPAVFALSFSSDGKWLASGSGDGTAHIWQVDEIKANAKAVLPHKSTVGALSFDRSGKLLATGDWSGNVRVWSVPDGTLIREENLGADDSARQVLITPDDRWLASCSGNTVWVHTLDESGVKYELRGHTDHVTLLDVDEGSQWLASGSWDGSVRLWSLADPEMENYVLRGHVKEIMDIAISSEGNLLATTEGSAEVLLWDVTDPEAPPVRLQTPGDVAAVAFGPKSQKVLAMIKNGGVMIWDLDVENIVELGCKLAGRALSREEWMQFSPDQPYSPRCLLIK